ncbi:hypothetical protein [Streptosporangium sp. NPDC020145]|uniref:hypothetical protein n=1 Tax=Streptosporangium sp. NPDC020145 TaxID=3154694 RepID=UPI0034403747
MFDAVGEGVPAVSATAVLPGGSTRSGVFTADDEPVMLSTGWEPFALVKGTPIG